MAIRKRIIWGDGSTLGDPRLRGLDQLIRDIRRRHGAPPPGVTGGSIFNNSDGHLPLHVDGYYKGYDAQLPTSAGRGTLRFLLGNGGEVYVTGNHYADFRQIINLPI